MSTSKSGIHQFHQQYLPITPVPGHAQRPTFHHIARSAADLQHLAEYRVGADLYGYVARFETNSGGKDVLTYTWCSSARDGAATWRWRQWDEPRPLYYPGHAAPEGRTVILVEGEKPASILQEYLDAHAKGTYCVATWPGGCMAWRKANWAWLTGQTVILWPDCDSKREKLPAAERQAHPDAAAQAALQQSRPFLPREKQPGWQAMVGIGQLLQREHGCHVQILPIMFPGIVPDGWDCADAISEGWDLGLLTGFFAKADDLPRESAAATQSEVNQ